MEAVQEFVVEREDLSDDIAVITPHGGVDIFSAPALKGACLSALDDGRRLLIDLTHAPFVDSTGLGVLVDAGKRSRGRRLSVVCDDSHLVRIFEIVGLDQLFGVYASRGEALAALRPRAVALV